MFTSTPPEIVIARSEPAPTLIPVSVKKDTLPEVLALVLALKKSVLAKLFSFSEFVAVPENLAALLAMVLLRFTPGFMVVKLRLMRLKLSLSLTLLSLRLIRNTLTH